MTFRATPALDINASLIGVAGGRARLATPALVVELDVLKRNIALMAQNCRAAGIALRPHAKTHKCATLAKLQLEAGAVGVCCAKLGEAEALAAEGITNILITAPIVAAQALTRLAKLNAAIDGLIVVVDSPELVAKLSAAGAASGRPLMVLVDLDPGLHRTGIQPGEPAYALAAAVAGDPHLSYEGLQSYAGQIMHVGDAAERRAKAAAVTTLVATARDELTRRNLPPKIVSGGGTGTVDIDPAGGVFTELQAGSYVFMDREYNEVWTKAGERAPFETSLFVQTTVISAAMPQLATTDAGLKSFACDAGPPKLASGAGPSASYFFFGDEQGGVLCEKAEDRPNVGDVLACVVPHCDPTVNLHDALHVVEGDTLVAIWPIEGRGRGF
ncbi:3-hydroxy-D-aspartate aldolase [Alphaproteobacteria bacterium SO-S41]|nr:3-hydroxy-D-aspartate aldolase [Alphaproteobacteria bacterium SO-S41]